MIIDAKASEFVTVTRQNLQILPGQEVLITRELVSEEGYVNFQGLSIWTITPDSGSRGKLREVLNAVVYKAEMRNFKTVKEALDTCETDTHPKLIFASFSLGPSVLTELLEQLKNKCPKSVPRVIVTMDSKIGDNSSAVAALFIQGVTGFISQPYSTSELSQLLQTVIDNRTEVQGPERIRRATGFLLVDAMAQIDQLVAQLWRGEEPSGYPLKEVRVISKNLKSVFEQDKEGYSNLIAEIFERAKPPAANLVRNKVKRSVVKASHPGAVICELMRERLLTPQRVAAMLKMDEAEFESLIREQRGIDEELSKNLARVLGRSSREWLKLQSEFDARSERKKSQPSAAV